MELTSLRIEISKPVGNAGALVVYLGDGDRGGRVQIEFNNGEGELLSASVVKRSIRGEELCSAWFPRVQPGQWRVQFTGPDSYHGSLYQQAKVDYVTVFAGEITEVDWR